MSLAEATDAPRFAGMRLFLIVWATQLISLLGSSMTQFGLMMWIYREADAVTAVSSVILAGALPALLVGPFAGTVVDRCDRRRVMLVADLVAGLLTVLLAVLWLSDELRYWHILVVAVVGSIADSFQQPAYLAAVTLLVPKAQLGRANGLLHANQGLGLIVAPLLAGLLVGSVGLGGVLLLDVLTCVLASATLFLVRFPEVSRAAAARSSFWAGTLAGWRFLTARRGLMLLLWLAAGLNFLLSFTNVLSLPLLMSFTTEAVFGAVSAVIGGAMLAGGLVASSWRGPERRVRFMLAAMSFGGLCVALSGVRASAVWIAAWSVGLMFLVPLFNATSQALWQVKVPPEFQGRVFATRRVIARVASPLAMLLAGPLADRVFEPLLAPQGALAGTFGAVIGTGPGRGVGLMFCLMGLGLLALSLTGFALRPLREVETDLPDAIP